MTIFISKGNSIFASSCRLCLSTCKITDSPADESTPLEKKKRGREKDEKKRGKKKEKE